MTSFWRPHVFNHIKANAMVTAPRIAKKLGLSLSAVEANVESLLGEGLIGEQRGKYWAKNVA